ncbi:thioredoxin [Demequina sp. NBRC 110053]|uniref:thioredoxin n=1 Tax=Demequina sp. NBRC 110053 TaxID=1570342 RepID=UPI000A022584|nr:thioredoxin [Demequina sp. NBRC 110053]
MSTVELTTDSFEQTVTKDGIVLVDFWAEWCGPCKRFAPIYDQSSEANPEIVHAKVDTEEHQELSAQFGITAIPTLMAFRDGIMVYNRAGAMAGPDLQNLVKAVEGLDMDEVRKQVAEQAAAQ